jgi:hypothetical protein
MKERENTNDGNSVFVSWSLMKPNYAFKTLYRNLFQVATQAAETSRLIVSFGIKSALPTALNPTFITLKVPAGSTAILHVKY